MQKNHPDLFDFALSNQLGKSAPSVNVFELQERHEYELDDARIREIFTEKVYLQIIKSRAFQRLKDIHFLGAIDYTISTHRNSPYKRHTRFQHSLGVARLALQYAKATKKKRDEEVLCVVAALLHDIGHAPLSHSLESVFKSQFNISHHLSGDKIIRGDVDIPNGVSLNKILLNNGINPFEVMAIIPGASRERCTEVFRHAINIDTIEGILRSSTYIYEREHFCSPARVLSALISVINKKVSESEVDLLDRFWLLKNDVYSKFINNRFGVYADYISQQYMRDNYHKFTKHYYYGTEKSLKRDHSKLFENLKKLSKSQTFDQPLVSKIDCKIRNFTINSNHPLSSLNSIDKRYTKRATPFTYNYIKAEGELKSAINNSSRALFKEEG